MTNAPWDNDQGQGGPDIESSPLTGDSLTPPKIEWGVFEKGSLPPNLMLDSAASESLLPMATKPKRRGGAVIGGLVGLAALAGGGIFAYRAFSSDPPKNTPEQAVTALLTAAQNRDVIGLAEALAPGERDALLDGVLPAVDELKRLEILDPSLNLHKVPGLEATYKDVKYETTQLRDDVAAVKIVGGRLLTNFDPSQLPIGKFVRDLAGDQLAKQTPKRADAPLTTVGPLLLIRDHNTWYLSLNYTTAYASTHQLPAKGSGVVAAGAPSPEDAVSDFLHAAATLDVRRLVQLMPPDELPALHDYALLFVPKAEDQVRKTREQYTVSFPGLKLTNEGSGATRTVRIAKFGAKVNFETSGGEQVTAELTGRCVVVDVDGDRKKRCGTDIVKLVEDFGGPAIDTTNLNAAKPAPGKNGLVRRPKLGFVVVQRDGQWFISPTRTVFASMTSTLKLFSREDLTKLEDAVKKAVKQVQDLGVGSSTSASGGLSSAPAAPDTGGGRSDSAFDLGK